MPVIGMPVQLLLERIATALDRDQLVEHLQRLGCDVEGYATVRRFGCQRCDNVVEITETEHPPVLCDRCGADFKHGPELLAELGCSDVLRMELLAVRPDMFDPGGLARVLRNYLGERDEPVRYQLDPPRLAVDVDARLAEPTSFRPCIACAVVRGITLDEDRIKVVMKLQENLHWALGRDRKHASIGVYDLATLIGPRFVYRTVGPDELRFVPLGHDAQAGDSALTPRQILAEHPKGVAYARLLAGYDRYPLLTDAAGRVLSLPPIINSEDTRVTRGTAGFFVDVTGTEQRLVDRALNILVTSMVELDPGCRLEQVTIAHAGDRGQTVTPDLTPQQLALDPLEASRIIGVELDRQAVAAHLRQMGHGVEDDEGGRDGALLRVAVPAYRNDIMHPIDLIEDVAIAYGYHRIAPTLVPTMTVGDELPVERLKNVCRAAMTGLGHLEVMTLILSSEEQQYDALRLPRPEDQVQIDNPISVQQTMVRTTLLSGLLDTLAVNTDHELPQLIFEVGQVSQLDATADTGAVERCRLAGAAIGPRVDYSRIRSTCAALLHELGWALDVEPDHAPLFIGGRGARVYARRGDQRLQVGRMGELHPEVLEGFGLVQPTAVFEIDPEPLA